VAASSENAFLRAVAFSHGEPLPLRRKTHSFAWSRFLAANRCHFAGKRIPLHGRVFSRRTVATSPENALGGPALRIKVINPNTTAAMTEAIGAAARSAAAPGSEIIAATSACGPASIEGHYDEAVSVIGLMEQIIAGEAERCDAYVIACFGDPGLLAARERANGPVIGIAEAAMRLASFVSCGFSIVTTLGRTRVIAEHLVTAYGMERACRRVRAIDVPVLSLDDPSSNVGELMLRECRRALAEDGSGAIVLGCAGMADLAGSLARELGVPVIDGVAAAVKVAEALVGLGLTTSRHGDLAPPLRKHYAGSLAYLAPP
jgi:allantoin racemase